MRHAALDRALRVAGSSQHPVQKTAPPARIPCGDRDQVACLEAVSRHGGNRALVFHLFLAWAVDCGHGWWLVVVRWDLSHFFSIGHPAAEWKQPAATVHRLKQSEHPAPEHPQRVPASGQQHRSQHAGDHRHPQLMLTDGSGYQFPYLLLGHAIRMPALVLLVSSSRHPCSQMAAQQVGSYS